MNQPTSLVLLALVLCALGGVAHGTETAVHNDFDGDGRSDVLWRNRVTGSMVYWPSADYAKRVPLRINTPANFDLSRVIVAGTGNYYDTAARTNILLRDNATSDHFLLVHDYAHGDGYVATLFALTYQLDADSKVVANGDFNGGTISDILVRNQRSGGNSIAWGEYPWDYGGPDPIAPVSNFAWQIVGAGDFDSVDEASDLLWRNTITGANAIWRMANANTPIPIARVSDLSWQIVAVGDFNADGKSDIFWRNISTGANAIWESGNRATSKSVVGVTNQNWQVAATGDYDGDGRFDVFWRNRSTGANVIWKSAKASSQQAVSRVASLDWEVIR